MSDVPPADKTAAILADFLRNSGELIKNLDEEESKSLTRSWEVARTFLHQVPPELKSYLWRVFELVAFFGEYGVFLCVWSGFELIIEIILMRELRLDPQEASIVCGGLSAGPKVQILTSLLTRSEAGSGGASLIREAQALADRNSFAHGFLYGENEKIDFSRFKRGLSDKTEK